MKKVLVGMSGGVDSSVAATLLLEHGYDVTGITFIMQDTEDAAASAADAKAVCDLLGIQHLIVDLSAQFKKHVIDYFISEYERGRTPNPCVICNKYIKFRYMAETAAEKRLDHIATGHYAGLSVYPATGRYALTKSGAGKKDQTYFLYGLSQEQLKSVIFPLSKLNKDEVRLLAGKYNLPTAKKSDSQEVCFITNDDYGAYIRNNTGLDSIPGNFVTADGEVLGKHAGLPFYTIGQRKGLGLAKGKPLYVISIDNVKNEILLGDERALYKNEFFVSNVDLQAYETIDREMDVTVKIRNQAPEAPAKIIPINQGLKIIFNEPQRAVTPGQAAVFYIDEDLIGGGIIQ